MHPSRMQPYESGRPAKAAAATPPRPAGAPPQQKKPAAAAGAAAATTTPARPDPFFPFSTAVRTPMEQRARRGEAGDELIGVMPRVRRFVSHVATIPAGTAALAVDEAQPVLRASGATEPAHVVSDMSLLDPLTLRGGRVCPDGAAPRVRVNVLLASSDCTTGVRRCFLAKPSTTSREMRAYGGVVSATGPWESHLLPQVLELLRVQLGAGFDLGRVVRWRKLCEVQYDDCSSGDGGGADKAPIDAVFVVPELSGSEPLTLPRVSVETVTKTVTRKEVAAAAADADDASVDGETEEERAERVAAAQKRKTEVQEEVVEKREGRTVLEPYPLDPARPEPKRWGGELDFGLSVLRELVLRDSMTVLRGFLDRCKEEKAKAELRQTQQAAVVESTRTQLQELNARKKKAYEDDAAKLEAAWEEEDMGDTMDEIEEKKPSRNSAKEELRKAVDARFNEAVAALEAQKKPAVQGSLTTKVVCSKTVMALRALLPTAVVDKALLTKVLLATDTQLCQWEAEAALSRLSDKTSFTAAATLMVAKEAGKEDAAEAMEVDETDPQQSVRFLADLNGTAVSA